MTDATNSAAPPPGVETATPATGGTSFLATPRGKLAAGGAVLALLAIAGIAVAIFVFGGALLSNPGGSDDGSTGRTPSVATTPVAPAAPAVNPPQKPLSSSFTFRNVFAPTIMPPSVEISTQPAPVVVVAPVDTPTEPGVTPPPVVLTTLTLTDIITEGDAHKGVFTYGTLTQTAGNGEVIGDSPWKVLEVGSDSVLMLFGDTQVTISIGQGIAK